MRLITYLKEMTYEGNIGFQEMVEFYKIASSKEIKKMEKIIKNEDWSGFKDLIYKKIGKKLK